MEKEPEKEKTTFDFLVETVLEILAPLLMMFLAVAAVLALAWSKIRRDDGGERGVTPPQVSSRP